jgi:hypothetical protein
MTLESAPTRWRAASTAARRAAAAYGANREDLEPIIRLLADALALAALVRGRRRPPAAPTHTSEGVPQ